MTETQQQILDLRALNLTPKEIARKLGIKVSEVSATIKHQTQQATLDGLASGQLDPVYQCLASENLVQLLPKTTENSIKNLLAKILPVNFMIGSAPIENDFW